RLGDGFRVRAHRLGHGYGTPRRIDGGWHRPTHPRPTLFPRPSRAHAAATPIACYPGVSDSKRRHRQETSGTTSRPAGVTSAVPSSSWGTHSVSQSEQRQGGGKTEPVRTGSAHW